MRVGDLIAGTLRSARLPVCNKARKTDRETLAQLTLAALRPFQPTSQVRELTERG
jgi:hypothetical protein